VTVQGKKVPTLHSPVIPRAVEIANTLKDWIKTGKFELTQPVASLPGGRIRVTFKPLNERPIAP